MKIAIVGSGLAGLTAAVDLVDSGHKVDIYESRSFWGGKVGSWEDKDGNHIEMGLHVFFYNYANLFKLMEKVGAIENYKYSKALAAYDKNWTFEELNGFLIKPAKWIKGTKMAYAGLRKEKDRASVIKYLNENSDSPLQLP